MIIGIPKERKVLENRVALTPSGALELTKRGHEVIIEKNAGIGSGFENNEYKASGCKLVDTLADVWKNAEILVKVKEPHESEFEYFREDLIIFDYLHLAGLPEVAKQLIDKKVTGIAYELISSNNKNFPLLEPMSEIAGKLSVINAANYLLTHNGGRGILPGGAVGVAPANITIIGAGIAGLAACRTALGLDANVNMLDISVKQLSHVRDVFNNKVNTIFSNSDSILQMAKNSDILISAVLIPGAKAPKIITEEVVEAMPKNSVIVDISIDQGGSVEGIKATSLENPVYVNKDVLHYAVPNMPSQVARTSTIALTSATLPFIVKLAENGIENSLKIEEFKNACCTKGGKFTNETIAEIYN